MAFVGELRPFQAEARDQLLEWGRGLLAVTMGGGKTPTTISVTEHLLETEQVECGLIITPASLKRQWNGTRGFPMFAPDANVVLIDGDADQRREQYLKAMHWAEYIILGYSQVTDDWEFVKKLPADFIVMDEVQAIKNPGSQRSQKMEKLLRKARKREAFILGLTGQPLENKPEDVFHVCAGIDPDVLGHPEVFDRTFVKRHPKTGRPVEYINLATLKKKLDAEIMVRVERTEIKEYLPDRIEEPPRLVPFDEPTLAAYTTVVRDLVAALEETQVRKNFNLADHYSGRGDTAAQRAQRGKIMSRLTVARMICDHPDLVRMSSDMYDVTKVQGDAGALKAGSAYAHELALRGVLDEMPRGTSPKMAAVVREVRKILADPEHKVVIFSQFKPTLTWLGHALRHQTECVLYHGGVSTKKREAIKERFNNDPDVRVFLSSDAGGAGVDLPGGSHLINYNLPFSAGQLDQRNARIDRMSTVHEEVRLLNFMMEGSVEVFYADVVSSRKRTALAGIDGRGNRSGKVRLPSKSLTGFLNDWLEVDSRQSTG